MAKVFLGRGVFAEINDDQEVVRTGYNVKRRRKRRTVYLTESQRELLEQITAEAKRQMIRDGRA